MPQDVIDDKSTLFQIMGVIVILIARYVNDGILELFFKFPCIVQICVWSVGHFSIYSWASSQPMREDVTYVTSYLIG